MHIGVGKKRKRIVVISFLCASFLVSTGALMREHSTASRLARTEGEMSCAVLCKMAEEANVLRESIVLAHTEATLSAHCHALTTCAELLFAKGDDTANAALYTSRFFEICKEMYNASDGDTKALYEQQMTHAATLLSDIALASLSAQRENGTSPARAALIQELTALTAPYTQRNTAAPKQESTPTEATHRREKSVTREEAAALLSSLPGNPGRLFGEINDEDPAVYRFYARDGYALISRYGGKLLALSLAPREPNTDASILTQRCTDEALLAGVNAFLSSAHIRASVTDASYGEMHGIRYYRASEESSGSGGTDMTVGVRISDGRVLFFSRG